MVFGLPVEPFNGSGGRGWGEYDTFSLQHFPMSADTGGRYRDEEAFDSFRSVAEGGVSTWTLSQYDYDDYWTWPIQHE